MRINPEQGGGVDDAQANRIVVAPAVVKRYGKGTRNSFGPYTSELSRTKPALSKAAITSGDLANPG